jgi:photosystem II stability/assembly factor-like uncharacterized protein
VSLHLAFLNLPATLVANQPFSISVAVNDASGKVVDTSTAQITVTGPSLHGGGTVAASAGIATFDNLSVTGATGSMVLQASAAGVATGTSNAFPVAAYGLPAAISFASPPSATVINAPNTYALSVLDTWGNVVSSYSGPVVLSVSPADLPVSGVLTGSFAFGQAVLPGIRFKQVRPGVTVTAVTGSLPAATTPAFSVAPSGPPTRLAFSGAPSSSIVNAPFSVSVEIRDDYDNLVPDATDAVTLGASSGGLVPATTTAVAGVAQFSGAKFSVAQAGVTLNASAAGRMAVTSSPFDVAAFGSAAGVAWGLQPKDTIANTPFAVSVGIVDSYGNVVANSAATISLGSSITSTTLAGTTSAVASAGSASFPAVKVTGAAASIRLVASSSGLPQANSAAFSVTAFGPAAALAFLVQPHAAMNGTPIKPAVTVRVVDNVGNVVTNAQVPIAVALKPSSAGGVLSGTTPVTTIQGVATFSDLSIDKLGKGYVLTASASGLPPVDSSAFDIQLPWVATGGPPGGTAYRILIDPNNTQTLYAGTLGGLYKSVDGAAHWSFIRQGQANVLAIGAAPVTTLYLGTTTTLLKSSDGGTSFHGIGTFNGVQSVGIDPTSSLTIYVGARDAIYKTTDGGTTWNNVNSGFFATAIASTILVDPSTPAVVYAVGGGVGIYKSTNGGGSWAAINNGALAQNKSVNTMVMDPAAPATLYAGSQDGAMLKTTDGGATWNTINSGFPVTYPQVQGLAISAKSSQTLYATLYGVGGIYKTVNGGATWASVQNGLTKSTFSVAVAIDPSSDSTVYYSPGQDGIFKSIDGAASWAAVNEGFVSSRVWAVAVDPADTTAQTIWAGTIEQGVLRSTNAGATWTSMSKGMNTTRTVHAFAFTPGKILAATDFGAYVSTDGAANWALATGSTNETYALAVDPTSSSVVFGAGIEGLYRSTDGGASFIKVNNGLAPTGGPVPSMHAVGVDPANHNIVYSGSDQMAFVSSNGGTSWSQSGNGLPSSAGVSSIAVDPRGAPST